jgi:isopentenyl-diphosphate Delta-isomerase
MENVILVNNKDEPLGEMEKLKAHQLGLLHRAFSVFLFDASGRMLLQQRAYDKYHSGGLWTNTCCSHPRPGENTMAAAQRRLLEEMGIEAALEHKGQLIYKTDIHDKGFEGGLIENEFDHIYFGFSNEKPQINRNEVADFKYLSLPDLKNLVKAKPHEFTHWFKLAIDQFF